MNIVIPVRFCVAFFKIIQRCLMILCHLSSPSFLLYRGIILSVEENSEVVCKMPYSYVSIRRSRYESAAIASSSSAASGIVITLPSSTSG